MVKYGAQKIYVCFPLMYQSCMNGRSCINCTVNVQSCSFQLCGYSRTKIPSTLLPCLSGLLSSSILSKSFCRNGNEREREREITVKGLPLELKNNPKGGGRGVQGGEHMYTQWRIHVNVWQNQYNIVK